MSGDIIDGGALAYLATPYRKYPGGPEAAFIAAAKLAALLSRAGIKVYSPIAHCHPSAVHAGLGLHDRSIWWPLDQAQLRSADVLIVAQLPTWEESHGMAEEIRFFEREGKPIYDLDPATLGMVRRKPPFAHEAKAQRAAGDNY
jgi:hypothetical protein